MSTQVKPINAIVATTMTKDPSILSRGELQTVLKAFKLPATGTTDTLRQRYVSFRQSNGAKSSTTHIALSSKEVGKPEKRSKRYRSNPPKGIQQRIDRALSQSMYLVTKSDVQDLSCTFVVLGSTGNVYEVTIRRSPHCSCPDHAKGNLCKHILFVLLKVMAIPSSSPLVYQQAWIKTELEEMYACMEQRFQQVSGAVLAKSVVRNEYAKLQRDPVPQVACRQDQEDCPICFDVLEAAADNMHCRTQCGANFHAKCISHWLQQQRSHPTCPNCRQPWEGTTKTTTNGGFQNLGRLQGQSPQRDMSSYSSWYRRYHDPDYYE
ncbi:E3 ubiquitin-protein ligase ZSWIM2 [Fistulifera solaris]|uniref:E3 ubiquitin-protein ligase ZSWIM2 n=1 Tax=Fistulifera solaris TaxID=1519565 RepID=A0A1Z5JCQ8_FISSO|nr:E3 ubiquitin-protein ligase ZSWIM2 [Fistulifera solaris]|eukprot:GAX11775.1 E3 ubiquitin-protein ligase ZSWIM2 [Fistulifera solaris]